MRYADYPLNDIECNAIREWLIEHLSDRYPHIGEWWDARVVPGLADGARYIVRNYGDDGELQALGIAKKVSAEKKICTVYVIKRARNKGIALEIIEKLLVYLGTTTPSISVDSDVLSELKPILAHFGFSHSSSHPDLYRDGATEYFFNGGAP